MRRESSVVMAVTAEEGDDREISAERVGVLGFFDCGFFQ